MKKSDSHVKKNKDKPEQMPSEKILAAFRKLNPDHVLDPGNLEVVLVIGQVLSGTWLPDYIISKTEENFDGVLLAMPNLTVCSLNTVEKEIIHLRDLTEKLKKSLSKVHTTTFFAMINANVHVKFEEVLGALDKAKKDIGQLKKAHPNWVKKSGRPKKIGALHIAEILANEYHRATKKNPTISYDDYKGKASGKFFNLVSGVFSALNVEADPEYMGDKAIELWANRRAALRKSKKTKTISREKSASKKSK